MRSSRWQSLALAWRDGNRHGTAPELPQIRATRLKTGTEWDGMGWDPDVPSFESSYRMLVVTVVQVPQLEETDAILCGVRKPQSRWHGV